MSTVVNIVPYLCTINLTFSSSTKVSSFNLAFWPVCSSQMFRHQHEFSMAWILHWDRLWSLHLLKMLFFSGPFLLIIMVYYHLSPSIQVYNKSVNTGSCHFTDPCKFTLNTFIVFHAIIGKNVFVALCPYKLTFLPNSWWIKIQSTDKSFLASTSMVLPFLYFLQAVPPFFHYQQQASWFCLQRH